MELSIAPSLALNRESPKQTDEEIKEKRAPTPISPTKQLTENSIIITSNINDELANVGCSTLYNVQSNTASTKKITTFTFKLPQNYLCESSDLELQPKEITDTVIKNGKKLIIEV